MSRPLGSFVRAMGPHLGLLGALYLSQGLPYGFFTQALPVLMREQGYSLADIGLSSLLALPWALKFLWAPVVDRYGSSRIGRRRSWIIPLQLASALLLIAVAAFDPGSTLRSLLVIVLLVNLLSATQDIATDGLAVDLLTLEERGFANGIQVAGYRLGMIIGGGLLLILYPYIGWSWTFTTMGVMILAASLPVLLTREPTRHEPLATTSLLFSRDHFLRQPGHVRLLILVVAYKAGDAFAGAMIRPYLVDAGLEMADIGWLLGTVGFIAGLFGALAGGSLVNVLGRRRALTWFGLLQVLTVLAYAWMARGPMSQILLAVICGAEHFAGGMATAALFTCMMDWCRPGASATDYTVQASAVVIATGAASSLSGFSAQALGYYGHFLFSALLTLLSVVIAVLLYPQRQPPDSSVSVEVTATARR